MMDRSRMTLQKVLNDAAERLPYGYEIRICAERDAEWVVLYDFQERFVPFDCDELSLPEQVETAIEKAIEIEGQNENMG